MNRTFVYVDMFTDEYPPASNLADWAKWLATPCPDGVNGPREVTKPGQRFSVTVCDVTYVKTEIDPDTAQIILPEDQRGGADYFIIPYTEIGGWDEDDMFGDLIELSNAVRERIYDGEAIGHIGIMRHRPGELTATFDVVDGEPVLQPDGWVL